MVRDNPSIFTKEILSNKDFQDGFVYALEKYLVERNGDKRKIFRDIFLGFAQAQNRETFSLEKFTHTLSQLGEVDIEVLRDIDVFSDGRNYQVYQHDRKRVENIFNLINLGLLLDVTGNRLGNGSEEPPFVKPTFFCKKFVMYLER